MRLLLEKGADPNGYNGMKCPHLVTTAEYGCPINLEMLIDYGALIGSKRSDGSTPLHRAAWHGHEECIQVRTK